MSSLRSARLVLELLAISPSLRRPRSSLASLSFSFSSSDTGRTTRRAFSSKTHSDDLFDYTTGRWIYNDALRHAQRRRVFNVDGLCRLAAQSVNRSPDDIANFTKLAEDKFYRIFLITMHDGFQMLARIPYPLTVPKYHAIASEAATMAFLRSSGLPVPEVYGYSPSPDNAAETEYIFMEYIQGTMLSEVWSELGGLDIISVMQQLVELESKMMTISFPAGGSLYYAKDLEKSSVPLEDERFCVGPDVRLPLWFGRRSQLDVDRGPYENVEAALRTGAHKELAFLEQFGRPLWPFQRPRRAIYLWREQSPQDHIENLNRFLLIASSLVPKDPAFSRFRMRHPDLQHSNIIVDASHQVVGLLDWTYTSILPLFLCAGIPDCFQNSNDPTSYNMLPPLLPEDFEDLNETEQSAAMELYDVHLTQYQYLKHTEECNEVHYDALTEPLSLLRRRLFDGASAAWMGETLDLKLALIKATENWETLTGGSAPCLLAFDVDDVLKTKELKEFQIEADRIMEMAWKFINCESPEGWVPNERYEEVMEVRKGMRERADAAMENDWVAWASFGKHWPFDDMDEEEYM